MTFFRRLARHKAPPSLPGPSSQEGATDLATSDAIATHGPLTELPPTEEKTTTVQTEKCAPDRSGHRYDRVQIGGESRNHLGDVYTKNVTYNYGSPYIPLETQEEVRYGCQPTEVARLKIEKKLEEERLFEGESRRLDFLQALRFNAMDSRLATIGPVHEDTCTWLVEAPEYVKWRNESCRSEHHGVLWIKGKPGSGKSTLMKYALNIAQERDGGNVVASFLFNARGQPLEKSAEGMYRSLLHQILTELPHLYCNRTQIRHQTWSVEMLETMLRTSVLALEPDEHIVIYIDALDECKQDEVRDVIGYLEDLVDLVVSRGLRLSICLSSRHYPHITMHKFEELILDDRNEHLEDISKYVHTNVARLSIPSAKKSEIEADINRRGLGVFLWAVLVIKILREKHDGGAPVSEILKSLATVPDKLGNLFASILANPDKGMITALQWTLYSQFFLTPLELYFAIKTGTNEISTGQWDEDDADQESIKRFITRSTRGLVEAVEAVEAVEDSYPSICFVQFIHESVREHLLQGGLASLTKGDPQLVEGFAHAGIARSCLSYLQLDSPKLLRYFETHRPLSLSSSERFPLLKFAANSLLYHAGLAYSARTLPLTFIAELPLRLLICSKHFSDPLSRGRYATEKSATLLYFLLISEGYSLAEALLASCFKTANPGVVTFGMTAKPAITFDMNVRCSQHYGGVLGAAAAYNQISLIPQILHLGAEVVPSTRNVCSPLLPAVASCSKEAVELLLQRGADVNAVAYIVLPESALNVAVRRDRVDIASILIAYGADLNYRNELGTALDYALHKRRTKMARLLWDAHFPKSEWDSNHFTSDGHIEDHWNDTATVHRIDYHTEDDASGNHDPGSDIVSLNDYVDSDIWEPYHQSNISIASAETI